ncbi:hypothetical protein BpHYR1_024943 [Brachionus plicatilis]|uniref:Uncharacterized protein n=1 Tax=Brachionus plicatilis TaxID=10195 RepID=A0A3M7PG27_BRAPC|nr:hypothetical protein BpHYR1_024943 [Brachionus plicatilis]
MLMQKGIEQNDNKPLIFKLNISSVNGATNMIELTIQNTGGKINNAYVKTINKKKEQKNSYQDTNPQQKLSSLCRSRAHSQPTD